MSGQLIDGERVTVSWKDGHLETDSPLLADEIERYDPGPIKIAVGAVEPGTKGDSGQAYATVYDFLAADGHPVEVEAAEGITPLIEAAPNAFPVEEGAVPSDE